jgi:hypothetical protein
MPVKGEAVTVYYQAINTNDGTPRTGDSANHALRVINDGVLSTIAASPAEVDATNAPGIYRITVAAGENTGVMSGVVGKSSTSNTILSPVQWTNEVNVAQIDATGRGVIETAIENKKNDVADAVLGRNVSNVEATAPVHTLAFLILAHTESSVSNTVWTINRTDGSTAFTTRTLTLDSDADPVVGID